MNNCLYEASLQKSENVISLSFPKNVNKLILTFSQSYLTNVHIKKFKLVVLYLYSERQISANDSILN